MNIPSPLRFVLALVSAIAFSPIRAPAQSPSTNTFPPWPTLGAVTVKYASQPMSTVERAAENGEVTAQHYLGYCYMRGLRVAADPKSSRTWFEKALRQGYLPSGYNLGLLYENRSLDFHDDGKALYYFKSTATKDLTDQKRNLHFVTAMGLASLQTPAAVSKCWRKRPTMATPKQ